MTTFANTSILSGKVATMTLNCSEAELHEGFCRRAGGAFLQDAFPMLTAIEREFIISGITPAEWEAEFGTGSEEE